MTFSTAISNLACKLFFPEPTLTKTIFSNGFLAHTENDMLYKVDTNRTNGTVCQIPRSLLQRSINVWFIHISLKRKWWRSDWFLKWYDNCNDMKIEHRTLTGKKERGKTTTRKNTRNSQSDRVHLLCIQTKLLLMRTLFGFFQFFWFSKNFVWFDELLVFGLVQFKSFEIETERSVCAWVFSVISLLRVFLRISYREKRQRVPHKLVICSAIQCHSRIHMCGVCTKTS